MPRPLRPLRALPRGWAAFVLVGVMACRGNVTVRGDDGRVPIGVPGVRPPGPTGTTGPMAGDDSDRPGRTAGRGAPGNPAVREVCRTRGVGRGWIAVDYVRATGGCPTSPGRDSVHTAAIIVALDQHPVGTELEVCVDQGIPRGWQAAAAAAPSSRCPGAAPAGELTTRRIQRLAR